MSMEDEFDKAAEQVATSDEVYDLKDALRRANDRLRKTKVTSDAVAEAAMQGAHDAVLASPRPKVLPYKPDAPATRRAAKPEVALLHLTDWQGSKVTTSYNTEVMKDRVRQVLKNSMKLVEIQRTDHPVHVLHRPREVRPGLAGARAPGPGHPGARAAGRRGA